MDAPSASTAGGAAASTTTTTTPQDAVVIAKPTKSSGKKRKLHETSTKPCHILMAANHTAHTEQQQDTIPFHKAQQLLDHPNDYIAKRQRAYEGTGWNSNDSSSKMPHFAWDGVSPVERALVDCCEPLQEIKNPRNEYGEGDCHNHTSTDEYVQQWVDTHAKWHLGGVLDVEKEVRFAVLLANECTTTAAKSLALAILERTLEVYLREENALWGDEDDGTATDDKNIGHVDASMDDTIDHDDDDDTMNTRSSRFTRIKNRQKRSQQSDDQGVEEKSNPSTDPEEDDHTPKEKSRRFERFFAAGGLKILNQWLEDAAGYDTDIVKRKKTAGKKKSSSAAEETTIVQRKAPSARPIVYTILRFLEHIPFDKHTIMKSKINKQIQTLGKRIAAIMEAREARKAGKEDLDNWTTDESVTTANALVNISQAVKALKASWREKTVAAPKRTEPLADPFAKLKAQMKSRLQEITQFEAGIIPPPEWYEHTESSTPAASSVAVAKKPGATNVKKGSAALQNVKKPPITQAAAKTTSTIKELAAKERSAERQENQQKFLQMMKSNKKHSLESLRERLRQQREEYNKSSLSPLVRKKTLNGGKGVHWKDGLKFQKMRNRTKLEEVFVFVKGTCASGGSGEDEEHTAEAHPELLR